MTTPRVLHTVIDMLMEVLNKLLNAIDGLPMMPCPECQQELAQNRPGSNTYSVHQTGLPRTQQMLVLSPRADIRLYVAAVGNYRERGSVAAFVIGSRAMSRPRDRLGRADRMH